MENEIEVNGKQYVLKSTIKNASNIAAKTLKGLKYVLIRTNSAGVHVGYLKSRTGSECHLLNARRLWYWNGAASLSQLAVDGVSKPSTCKFPCEVPEIDLLNVIEVIPMSEKARLSVAEVAVWQQ